MNALSYLQLRVQYLVEKKRQQEKKEVAPTPTTFFEKLRSWMLYIVKRILFFINRKK
jgi:hypothetical protein